MAVIDVKKDFDALTLTITAEFDADIARVWELWADPRKLERWWGPPTYPVTFVDENGHPNTELPVTRNVVTLTQLSKTRTRMVIVTTFSSREAMEQILETGFAEVIIAGMGQMDEL